MYRMKSAKLEMKVSDTFGQIGFDYEWDKAEEELLNLLVGDDKGLPGKLTTFLAEQEEFMDEIEFPATGPTDSILQTAAEIYLYMLNTPDTADSTARKKYFFANASPRNILETVLNMNKVKENENKNKDRSLSSSTKKLVHKLGTLMKFNIGKLDIASSTKSGLLPKIDNAEFAQLREGLLDCLQRNNCTGVEGYLKSIGYYKKNY